MRNRSAAVLSSVLVGCAGVSPDPAQMAEALPVEVVLDQAERLAVERDVAEAMSQAESRDFVAAAEAAERALARDPCAARALAIRATARQQRAAAESPPALAVLHRAEGELRQATRLAPRDPVVALWHARFLAGGGHLSAAAQRAEEGLAHTSRLAGHVQSESSRAAKILRSSDTEADVALLGVAARLRHDLGDEHLAVGWYARLCDLRPDDPEPFFRLGECRLNDEVADDADARRDALHDAAAAFQRVTELVPEDSAAWLGRAGALAALFDPVAAGADPTEILALFATASALDPSSPRADHDRGVFLDRLGRVAEARRAYEDALERDADYLPSLLNLAASQADAGLLDSARANCRHALELEITRDERKRIEDFLTATFE